MASAARASTLQPAPAKALPALLGQRARLPQQQASRSPCSLGKLQQQRHWRRPVRVAAAAGMGGSSHSSSGGGGGGSSHSHRQPEHLLNALSSSDRAGSEYGEGFMQFRLSGERVHLDVDTLNEQMKIQGKQRIRHSMRPDEAFGLIFNWDNVIADTRELQRQAWRGVAAAEGLPFPQLERPQLYDMRPERAAMDVLMWTRDWKRAQELAWLVACEYGRLLMEVSQPLDGVVDWLQLMSKTKVPCALVTSMDRHTTDTLLDKLGLRAHFSCTVTADDDMETVSQRYLSAAIKLGRPPNACVVFAAEPTSITAAHNCTMKAVALLGTHAAFNLKNADLTCASMSELSVYNIRRLFANRGSEHMDLRNHFIGQSPPKRRLANATHDGDDEDEP